MKKLLITLGLIATMGTGYAQVGGSLSKQSDLSQTMPSFSQCRSYVFNMSMEMTDAGATLISFHEDLNRKEVNIIVLGPNGRIATFGCQNNLMIAKI